MLIKISIYYSHSHAIIITFLILEKKSSECIV